MIQKNSNYLMLKITTPTGIDFCTTHNNLITKHGYVWFCRFGKTNLKIASIDNDGKFIFVKESKKNGDAKYLLIFDEIETNINNIDYYPSYYNHIDKNKDLWFRITKIVKLDDNLSDYFKLTSSNGPLEGAYRSMCNSFYITCKKDYPISF